MNQFCVHSDHLGKLFLIQPYKGRINSANPWVNGKRLVFAGIPPHKLSLVLKVVKGLGIVIDLILRYLFSNRLFYTLTLVREEVF
jgi:hypothetical protein